MTYGKVRNSYVGVPKLAYENPKINWRCRGSLPAVLVWLKKR